MAELLDSLIDIDSIYAYIRGHSAAEILDGCARLKRMDAADMRAYPMGGYSRGGTSGAYYFTIADMKENTCQYLWLYARLADEESRRVLLELCRYRLYPDDRYLNSAYDGGHPQYFDSSIITCAPGEVFVDRGGFTGDTTEEFIRLYPEYGKIYIFGPSPINVAECKKNMEDYRNIEIVQARAGKERSEQPGPWGQPAPQAFQTDAPRQASHNKAYFSRKSSASSIMHQGEEGADEIDILSLDARIKEPVDFIKMDIEGSEIDALEGARRHIIEESPKLAVCLYHMVTDLWEIPMLIDTMNPDYLFYLRHYEETRPWETVLYAVKRPQELRNGGFSAGYLRPDDCAYAREHAKEWDMVIMSGVIEPYFAPPALYRELRPDGIVCLQLVNDVLALDQIPADTAAYSSFFNMCSVILASSEERQRWLMRKCRRRIGYLPGAAFEQNSRLAAYLCLLAAANDG